MSVTANAISKIKSKSIVTITIIRFVVSVAPVISSFHTTHFIIFDDYEEVVKLSKEFLTFEDILKNLEYRENSLHLKQKIEPIKYVSIPLIINKRE
jgi:hypothetical protein